MNPNPTASNEKQPRDAIYWAQQVSTLKVTRVPTGALNLNVEGRQVVGPLQGFGQMWQKFYWIVSKESKVTSTELIKVWKEHFDPRHVLPNVVLSTGSVSREWFPVLRDGPC